MTWQVLQYEVNACDWIAYQKAPQRGGEREIEVEYKKARRFEPEPTPPKVIGEGPVFYLSSEQREWYQRNPQNEILSVPDFTVEIESVIWTGVNAKANDRLESRSFAQNIQSSGGIAAAYKRAFNLAAGDEQLPRELRESSLRPPLPGMITGGVNPFVFTSTGLLAGFKDLTQLMNQSDKNLFPLWRAAQIHFQSNAEADVFVFGRILGPSPLTVMSLAMAGPKGSDGSQQAEFVLEEDGRFIAQLPHTSVMGLQKVPLVLFIQFDQTGTRAALPLRLVDREKFGQAYQGPSRIYDFPNSIRVGLLPKFWSDLEYFKSFVEGERILKDINGKLKLPSVNSSLPNGGRMPVEVLFQSPNRTFSMGDTLSSIHQDSAGIRRAFESRRD